MTSKIDRPPYIDCHLEFSSISAPFWDPFWNHFPNFGIQNGGALTRTTLLGWLLAQLLLLKRLGDPIWDDLGSMLGPFLDHFGSKNGASSTHQQASWVFIC